MKLRINSFKYIIAYSNGKVIKIKILIYLNGDDKCLFQGIMKLSV